MEKSRLYNPWIYAVLLRVRLALDGAVVGAYGLLLVWAALSAVHTLMPFSSSTQELCSEPETRVRPEPLTNREAGQDTCALKGLVRVLLLCLSPLYSLLVAFSSYKR